MPLKDNKNKALLNQEADVLLLSEIYNSLSKDLDIKIDIVDSTESTSFLVRQKAAEGEKEGCIVVAREQKAGRGRMGRGFFSPKDTGIYMSMLLRPAIKADEATLITCAAAVAVAEAIESLSNKAAQIKWVNDIFADGKKVCGILTEAVFSPENRNLEYAVVGIGINVYEPENGFPEEIKDTAGAVFETERGNIKNRLLAEVINRFFSYYKDLNKKAFVEQYKKRSCILGKDIFVIRNAEAEPAEAIEIDDECRLKVRYNDGREQYLWSGEISIRVKKT